MKTHKICFLNGHPFLDTQPPPLQNGPRLSLPARVALICAVLGLLAFLSGYVVAQTRLPWTMETTYATQR